MLRIKAGLAKSLSSSILAYSHQSLDANTLFSEYTWRVMCAGEWMVSANEFGRSVLVTLTKYWTKDGREKVDGPHSLAKCVDA